MRARDRRKGSLFMLKPSAKAKLRELARAKGLSLSRMVELLILRALVPDAPKPGPTSRKATPL